MLRARFENCGRLKSAELELTAGQIVGIGGVAGSGQDTLVDLISGEQTVTQGELFYLGQDVRAESVAARRRRGLRTLPVDRLGRAAAAGLNLQENLLLTHSDHTPLQEGAWIDWRKLASATDSAVEAFDIQTASNMAAARDLSGGNLQRFLVARELLGQPRLLVCYNPTWGVDPGAAARIHQALLSAREDGAAILLLSEDIDELFLLCDRLGALCNGRLSPVLDTSAVTPALMGRWMTEQSEPH